MSCTRMPKTIMHLDHEMHLEHSKRLEKEFISEHSCSAYATDCKVNAKFAESEFFLSNLAAISRPFAKAVTGSSAFGIRRRLDGASGGGSCGVVGAGAEDLSEDGVGGAEPVSDSGRLPFTGTLAGADLICSKKPKSKRQKCKTRHITQHKFNHMQTSDHMHTQCNPSIISSLTAAALASFTRILPVDTLVPQCHDHDKISHVVFPCMCPNFEQHVVRA